MYEKQGFYSGQKLQASQLDAMEDGIIEAQDIANAANTTAAEAKELAMASKPVDLNMEKGAGTGATQQAPRADKVHEVDGKKYFTIPEDVANATGLNTEVEYGAIGNYSATLGGRSSAQNKHAVAIGNSTVAIGEESFAQGYAAVAKGNSSFAGGSKVRAEGEAATAHGLATNAIGRGSFTIGLNTIAVGEGAMAQGAGCNAEGDYSVAIGNNTFADGHCAYAGGSNSQALGNYSYAHGINAIAANQNSYAFGYKTRAGYNDQFVLGRCNNTTRGDGALFIIGCGSDADGGENAFEVYSNGDIGIKKGNKIYSLHKMLAAYFTDTNLM